MDEGIRKKHHIRDDLCTTRPKYRDGRKLTAVKVYTINHESQYLLVQGVPAINVKVELVDLFSSYGEILSCERLEDYSAEEFTEVYLFKFARIQSARFAKRFRDDYNFYGGILHVCYAPEYESVEETSKKLEERKKSVLRRIRQLDREAQKEREQDELNSATVTSGSEVPGPSESVATEEDAANFPEDALPGTSGEQPVIIELPEEFFFASDDIPSGEYYRPLPPPPSASQSVPYLYPSQLTNPIIVPQDQTMPDSLQPRTSVVLTPR